MKTIRRTLPLALALGASFFATPLLLAAPAAGMTHASARADGRNAALYYWRAFYTFDRDFQRASSDLLPSDRAPDWAPDASTVTKLRENGSAIRQLLDATRIDKCDFGIAYEEGFMALIPHLGLMRSSARILTLDARRLMSEGNPDAAAERIAAIYRMSVHLRNDNVLISSLVSIAMASLASDEAANMAVSGRLTPAGRDAIVAALQPLNQADGFAVKRCIDMERRITADYLRRTLTGPDAGKKLLEFDGVEFSEDQKKQLGALDEAAIDAELDKIEVAYRDILEAWDDKNHEARFRELERKTASGDYGVLAALFLPSLPKAKAGDVKAAAKLGETLQALMSARLAEPAQPPAAPAGNR